MNTFYRHCICVCRSGCEILQAEMKGHLPLKRGLYQSCALLYILLETTIPFFVIFKNLF